MWRKYKCPGLALLKINLLPLDLEMCILKTVIQIVHRMVPKALLHYVAGFQNRGTYFSQLQECHLMMVHRW